MYCPCTCKSDYTSPGHYICSLTNTTLRQQPAYVPVVMEPECGVSDLHLSGEQENVKDMMT